MADVAISIVTPTMKAFGHPHTLIADYQWWAVLLRPKAVTLGSLILAAKVDVTAFSDLPPAAFVELGEVVTALEKSLGTFCSYEKINYLMLMMVDPEPHFHVFPRYDGAREFAGLRIEDAGWSGPPKLDSGQALSDEMLVQMRDALKAIWVEGKQ